MGTDHGVPTVANYFRLILTMRALLLVCLLAPCAVAEDAVAYLGSGLKLFDLERYREAVPEFERALQLDPKLDQARYHLAVSYFNLHRYPEARQQFEQLQASGYKKIWDTYYLGRLDLLAGQTDKAIEQFESLGGDQPLYDESYYLASAYFKEGQNEKAILNLKRYIAFNPRDFRAHNLLARVYMKSGKNAEAEREFQVSGKLHQYYLEGKRDLMDCHAELSAGAIDQAWRRCGPILETDDIDKLVAAGSLFGEFKVYDYALRLLQRALALDPEAPEINYDLGYTYFQKREYQRAREFLAQALRLRPDFFEALTLEGSVLYLLRDDEAALEALRRAHQLRPGDTAVSGLLARLENTAPK
jgi:tetratricopeptide (TPR) repeat protein